MNKDQKTKEYIEKWQGIKLSESSRARIENNLLEYARFHSVRVENDDRSVRQVPQRTSLFTLFKPKSMIATIIAIALIAGGGTSYAAEGAVPGDALYVVKTEVNENIKSALAVSNEAEARLQARLVEERLEEAEKLATRGELTAETSADLSARLNEHYKKAEERGNKEAERGNIKMSGELRASLEGTFRSYGDTIATLNARVKGNEGQALIAEINVYANAQAHAQATATVDASADIEKDMADMIARVDVVVDEANAKLADAKATLDAKAYTRINTHATEMVAAQGEAKAQLAVAEYQEAYQSAQKAIRLAHEVSVMTKSILRIKAEVKTSVLDADTAIEDDSTKQDRKDTATSTETKVKDDDYDEGDIVEDGVKIKTDTKIDLDTSVDTNVIEAKVDTDASVQTNTGLGL